MSKIVVMIPTYNEKENIPILIDELLKLPLDLKILVVDDNSPDETFKVVDKISKSNSRVCLLLRKENRGRGSAGIDGFKKAIELGADYVVEMDGDMSHSPKFIPVFYERIQSADIVIGSRYIKDAKDEKRTFIRKLISVFARNYISIILGLKIADPTSGFRMFKKDALIKILPHLTANDSFIVTEVLFYAKRYGLKIVEFPIEFYERASGKSKLKSSTLIKYLFRVLKLKFMHKNSTRK